jgi:hypothetical protein
MHEISEDVNREQQPASHTDYEQFWLQWQTQHLASFVNHGTQREITLWQKGIHLSANAKLSNPERRSKLWKDVNGKAEMS